MNHETDGTKQNINCKINNVFVVATNTAVNHYLKNNQKKSSSMLWLANKHETFTDTHKNHIT